MPISRTNLRRHYREQLPRFARATQNLHTLIDSLVEDLGHRQGIRSPPAVQSSTKEFPSFWDKAQKLEREERVTCVADCFVEIHDIARARVICQTVTDAERIRQLIREQDKVALTSKHERVHAPRSGEASTGYRAIHIDMEIDAICKGESIATPCELQVMTALQYAWGLYTHKDFYKGEGVPPLVAVLMRELSDLLNVADQFAGHLISEVESLAA
jgi:ppGpp synthetase/RelA/SpoT-type nucleotidyltranferase